MKTYRMLRGSGISPLGCILMMAFIPVGVLYLWGQFAVAWCHDKIWRRK